MLQDGSQTLQPHAGVHTRRGQFDQAAVGLHVELHEHVVPDFNEPVAVFFRAAGRAAGNVCTVVVKNLGARAAWASVSHHPKIVRRVFFAFVVADAHDAISWQTDFFVPNIVGLVVIDIHRDHETLGRQFVHLSQQLPTPFQAVALEVIAEAPITQHLEKCVMPCGVAHVFQVVVFAAGTQTGLHRGRAHIRAFIFT